MQLHQLKPKHKKEKKKRVGRGGKRGTYSGRGIKGQKARSGRTSKPIIRELIKKYPKLRGYNQDLPDKYRLRDEVNVSLLEKHFKEGEEVTPKALIEKGLVSKMKGRIPEVKILGRGDLKKKLTIKGCKVSKRAKNKIEKVGGKINN